GRAIPAARGVRVPGRAHLQIALRYRLTRGRRGRMTTPSMLRMMLVTFGSVFIAELGDKTQLATMALSGDAGSPRARLAVFLGASLALISTSAIGVLAGALVSRWLSPSAIQRAAGLLFIALGAWMLWSSKSGT